MRNIFENAKHAMGTLGDKIADTANTIKEQAGPAAEKAKETIVKKSGEAKVIIDEKIAAMKETKPTILEVKKSKIKILIPNGYEKSKLKKLSKDEDLYEKQTSTSKNILSISPSIWEDSMLAIDKETIINLTRSNLAPTQGLIEVNTGVTERGENYGYSIIKELSEESVGVIYLLRMNIGNKKDTINIRAYFIEGGMTGMRDSIGFEYARNAGLTTVSDNGIVGWAADPYDPNYKEGKLKNLSENPFMDAMFPDHPLSQARELVLALTKDQLIVPEGYGDDSNEDKEQPSKQNGTENLAEYILNGVPNHTTKKIPIETKTHEKKAQSK